MRARLPWDGVASSGRGPGVGICAPEAALPLFLLGLPLRKLLPPGRSPGRLGVPAVTGCCRQFSCPGSSTPFFCRRCTAHATDTTHGTHAAHATLCLASGFRPPCVRRFPSPGLRPRGSELRNPDPSRRGSGPGRPALVPVSVCACASLRVPGLRSAGRSPRSLGQAVGPRRTTGNSLFSESWVQGSGTLGTISPRSHSCMRVCPPISPFCPLVLFALLFALVLRVLHFLPGSFLEFAVRLSVRETSVWGAGGGIHIFFTSP